MAKCRLRNGHDCDDETTACQHMIYRSVGWPGCRPGCQGRIHLHGNTPRSRRTGATLLHSTTLPVDTSRFQLRMLLDRVRSNASNLFPRFSFKSRVNHRSLRSFHSRECDVLRAGVTRAVNGWKRFVAYCWRLYVKGRNFEGSIL